VLYWYETATFKVNQTAQQKHVKISLVAFPRTKEEISIFENQLLSIAQAVVNYWQPIKAWTSVALAISQSGPILTTSTAILLLAVIIFYEAQNLKLKKSLQTMYHKLSSRDKLLIQKIVHKSKVDKLSLQLQQLEQAGIIKRKIVNYNDEPIMIVEKAF
jgi:hypothetical protein